MSDEMVNETEELEAEEVPMIERMYPLCVISKETFGDDAVHDIQMNSAWSENPYGEAYALVPDELVPEILDTCGYCDLGLNESGTEVASFTARKIAESRKLDDLRREKKIEVSDACEAVIYAGVNVTLADGTVEHFSLTEHDQLNLFGKQAQLNAGAEQLEYHADGQPCRYYSAADMQTIIDAAMFHVSYHTTYCNALNMWIAGCETAEEVQAIFYDADVPEEYQSDVLKAYLLQIAQLAESENDAQTSE